MVKKYLKILLVASLILLSISAVSADNITIDDVNYEVNTENEIITNTHNDLQNTISNTNNENNNNDDTYTDLQNKINNASESSQVELNKNVIYTQGEDESLIGGIQINKSITLDGKDFTINGNNTARIFNITADNVVIKNINLINGNTDLGGIVYNSGKLSLENSTLNGTGHLLYNNGELSLDNNIIISDLAPIFNNKTITSQTYLTISDYNNVIQNQTIDLKAILTDDNNNAIVGQNITLTINGITTNINNLINNKTYYAKYNATTKGKFNITGNATGVNNLTVNNGTITVKDDPNLDVNVTSGDLNLNIKVIVDSDATGNVTIKIGDKTYYGTLVNRVFEGTYNVSAGDYNVTVIYDGDEIFGAAYYNETITIPKLNTTLVGNNVVMYYKNGTRYYVKLTDINGNPIANTNVTININGQNYTRTTDENGIASIALNLNQGIYNVTVLFNGTDNYNPSETNNTIEIKTTITSENIVKFYNNGTKLIIVVVDGQGNPLNNITVVLNINGQFYTLTTDENGTAFFDSNLLPGNYVVTINNTYNGELKSNNISVISTINSSDIVMYYNNGTKYTATILDGQGNPLNNTNVTIVIDGKTYNLTTDENGTVTLDLDFQPGNYTLQITNHNDNLTINNTITIKATIKSEDIVMYYNNGTKYTATILDGQGNPLNNTNVTIVIDGKTYNLTTDENGTVTLDLDFQPGNYTLQITNHNDNLTINNTITIKTTIITKNIVKYYRNGTQYIITILDGQGNPLNNTNVTININGQNYTRTTDENGTIVFSINLNPGNYTITVTNLNDNLTVTNNITVLSTINGSDIVKFFRNGTQYYVTILDGEGKPIIGHNVTMNINGVFYNRTTDENGTAMLAINLNPGNYTITVTNPNDGLQMSNNILVKPTVEGNDIVKFFRNGTQYYVTILDGEGKPIIGHNVTMNINGVFYNRTTDENGTAKLNINLNPGNYTITVTNPENGLQMSNNIEVLQTLIGEDLEKTFGGDETYDILVLDGQGNPLANQNITINIHGVFYYKTTDSNGIAKLNINLNPGDYIATAYWNDYATSNNVVVKNA